MKGISQLGRRTGLRSSVALISALALLAACEKELILEGERFGTRVPLEASIPVDGQPAPTDTSEAIDNESRPISIPASRMNGDWTHRAGNARHLAGNVALSGAPQLVWAANIGSGNSRRNRIVAAPVVAGGRIYTMDALGVVTATANSGATLWQVATAPQGSRDRISGGGLAFGGGRVVATTGHGEVLAIDPASGAVAWRQRLDSPAASAATVDGNQVFVVGRDGGAWALRLADGRVDWQLPGVPSKSGVVGAGSPAVSDRFVIFPFANGQAVAAQKADGERVWSAQVQGSRLGRGYGSITDITGDPVIDGGTTYIGNQSGRTVAVDSATGRRRWTAQEAAYGPVIPTGGSVFLINDEAKLARLDAGSGETIWAVDMPYYTDAKERRRKMITAHYGPILAGGRLAVASGDGLLRLFNPTDGRMVSTVEIPSGAAAAPAVAGGVLYVVSKRGQLLAFR
ncbi:MAG: PQQ-binding-like beta-propeller repeat protein [Pseudorhodobacter sp.]